MVSSQSQGPPVPSKCLSSSSANCEGVTWRPFDGKAATISARAIIPITKLGHGKRRPPTSLLCHDRRHAPSQRLFLGRRALRRPQVNYRSDGEKRISLPDDSGLDSFDRKTAPRLIKQDAIEKPRFRDSLLRKLCITGPLVPFHGGRCVLPAPHLGRVASPTVRNLWTTCGQWRREEDRVVVPKRHQIRR